MIAQDSGRDGSKPLLAAHAMPSRLDTPETVPRRYSFLGAGIFSWISTRRSEVDARICLEICHVPLDRIEGNRMCKATTPDLPINGAEDHEVLTVDRSA